MNNPAVQSLTRQDASAIFAEHCEILLEQWKSLLQKTTLLTNIMCTDNRVLKAFKVLNLTIAGSGAFSRLAYVRLAETWATLKNMIETDRQNGRIPP
ncbi:hypothetical protein QBC46DRAFT_270052 [Diplogelasinospora grovesii]|uniref:Uncharacterized protein n=1 Tax=Diplogelasinospora grovesii TaxID=303347 RepID=A0AAN6MZ85_9PEZI|nr:hypothetical protein QBC46DRAFT_270052 [Diplogelasinospora grovesii]